MSFQPPYRSSNPYDSPVNQMSGKPDFGIMPPVHFWFKVYCVFAGLYFLLIAGLGGAFVYISSAPDILRDLEMKSEFSIIVGVLYIAIGVGGMCLFFAGLVFNRGKGGWVFGIVLICLGLMNICTLPACIPLLIFWIRTDNKNAITGVNQNQ